MHVVSNILLVPDKITLFTTGIESNVSGTYYFFIEGIDQDHILHIHCEFRSHQSRG